MKLTKSDEKLINLLRGDGRCSVSALARRLGVSRAAVQQRMRKLEENGVIDNYTVVLGNAHLEAQVRALIMIKFPPKLRAQIEQELTDIEELTALYSISGAYDMAGVISAGSMARLDSIIDLIGALEGIDKTLSSIILSTKIMR